MGMNRRRWTGMIEGGALKGYSVEVRRQHLPWQLYILAFTAPESDEEPEVTFASGRAKLAEHLQALSISVTWSDGRGPLAPERDHTVSRIPRPKPRRGASSVLSQGTSLRRSA